MSASCASKIDQNLTGDDYVADSISEHSGHPTHEISQWMIISRNSLSIGRFLYPWIVWRNSRGDPILNFTELVLCNWKINKTLRRFQIMNLILLYDIKILFISVSKYYLVFK